MKKFLLALMLMPLMSLADIWTDPSTGITWTYAIVNGEAQVGTGGSWIPAIPTSTKGTITIPSTLGGRSVTSIGDYAFGGCSGLFSVTIPEGVTSIGKMAFYNCSGLTSVTIPEGVTSIGDYAFYGCSGQTSVTIPSSVESVGMCAFRYCSGLTEVHITDLLAWCRISFSLSDSNPLYIAHRLYLNGVEVTDLEIPSSVTSIGDYAFYGCNGLTSVTIPEGVTSIGGNAFYNCSGLTTVTIPSSVTSIEGKAFYNCSGLTEVHISDLSAWCRISFSDSFSNPLSCAHHLFLNGAKVTNLKIPEGVTNIGNYAFYGCNGLTSVAISEDVTSIGNYAFYYCNGLTSVAIPLSVTSIGGYAFYCCSGLTTVTIPEGVTRIEGHAFDYCIGLTTVTIPSSVTSIGDGAFYGCRGLTSVAIPSSVKSIGSCAFDSCNIVVVFVPENPQECVVQCFGTTMWYQRSDTPIRYEWSYSKVDNEATITGIRPAYGDVEIPMQIGGLTVTRIGAGAFESCHGLVSVKIPSSVRHIGDYAFGSCDGLVSMRIPEGVTSIGDCVFYGCVKLEDVWFSDSVLTMGKNMFTKCAHLSTVRLPAMIDIIPDGMFADCWALSAVEIPAGVRTIGEMAFQHCRAIEYLVIPASVESILPEAFRGSPFCVTVEEGNNKFLSENGVLYDKGRERLIFCPTCIQGKFICPASVRRIDAAAFCECTGITSIDIGDGVVAIGSRAFEDCRNLQEMALPKNISVIEESVFEGCTALTSMTVPNGVVKIAPYAFAGCTSLRCLSLPSTIEDITRMFAWGVSGADTILFKGLPPMGLDTIASQEIKRILYNQQFINEWSAAANAAGLSNIEPAYLVNSDVFIPCSWSSEFPRFAEMFGPNFAEALIMKTGKKDGAGNDMYVWEDYVAGTDPTDPEDKFKVKAIKVENGKVEIEWEPDLNEKGTKNVRVYKTFGSNDLKSWDDATGKESGYKFFKVSVDMP